MGLPSFEDNVRIYEQAGFVFLAGTSLERCRNNLWISLCPDKSAFIAVVGEDK
jgi:hypothetical protein